MIDAYFSDLIYSVMQEGISVQTRNSQVKRIDTRIIEMDSTPLVSLRKTSWKLALREWQWFMSGSSNIKDLHPSVHHWWAPWADKEGFVKNNYSQQFCEFYGRDGRPFDQIENFLKGVDDHPNSRRNCITTWNTADMASADTPITNCHNSFTQAFCEQDKLNLTTYQRSVDVICGLPHNLIQMWAFLLWLSHRTGKKPGTLKWIGGDIHIYQDHEELAKKMCRVYLEDVETPELVYNPTSEKFLADDFSLVGEYKPILMDKAVMVV